MLLLPQDNCNLISGTGLRLTAVIRCQRPREGERSVRDGD